MKPKYELGQEVFVAYFSTKQVYVTCPECGGTGRVRVIFHDETIASCECGNCSSGYERSTGKVLVYQPVPEVKPSQVIGISIQGGEVEYQVHHSYQTSEKEDKLFLTHEEALAKAQELAAEYEKEQLRKMVTKEKDTKSWAWHASYYRNKIKDAEKNIAFYTTKLSVASLKAKEDKKP